MLEINNLTAGYGGPPVLKDVSFTLPTGSRLAVVGPNGSGKTTLLRAIMNLVSYSGSIELHGRQAGDYPPKELAKTAAMLSQTTRADFAYSVYETVAMGRYPHLGRGLFPQLGEADTAAIAEAMRALSLWELRDRSIAKLSGGQLQRVFLAKALAQAPRIILLDEPTNHLDLRYQFEMIDFLVGWSAQNNITIVGVMHDLGLAVRLSQQVLLLGDGEVRGFGPAESVLSESALIDVYGVNIAAYMRETLGIWGALGS